MKLKAANSNSCFKAMMCSVLMLSLALVLLVFSCPLKKMLTKGESHTSVIRTNQTNQPEKNNGDQNLGLNSCSIKKDGRLVNFVVSKEVKAIPAVLRNQNFLGGSFSNLYYLSVTTGYRVSGNPVSYSVPLFLRHLSLLI